jgi:hypothetical protein
MHWGRTYAVVSERAAGYTIAAACWRARAADLEYVKVEPGGLQRLEQQSSARRCGDVVARLRRGVEFLEPAVELRTSATEHLAPRARAISSLPSPHHHLSRDIRKLRNSTIQHAGYLRDTHHVRGRALVAQLRTRGSQCHQQPDPRCLHRGAHTAPAGGRRRKAHIQEGGVHAKVDSIERSGAHFRCM